MHGEYNRALTRLAYRSTRQITDAAKNCLSVLNVVRRANIKRHAAAARNYIMSVISSSRPPSNHTNDRRQRCSRHRNTSANSINYPANLAVQAHSPSTTNKELKSRKLTRELAPFLRTCDEFNNFDDAILSLQPQCPRVTLAAEGQQGRNRILNCETHDITVQQNSDFRLYRGIHTGA